MESGGNWHVIIRCGICGQSLEVMTKAHLRIRHNMTREQYLSRYPEHAADAYWPVTRRHAARAKARVQAAAGD